MKENGRATKNDRDFTEPMMDEIIEEDYTSCTYGDYSPSNPWDAPGMSLRDFI
ncbi:hypothetical protein [Eisenbergiella sp.]